MLKISRALPRRPVRSLLEIRRLKEYAVLTRGGPEILRGKKNAPEASRADRQREGVAAPLRRAAAVGVADAGLKRS
jgi:hypothetical protein